MEEAVVRIKACVDARVYPDFVINARTDALATGGLAEVIRRGNAYLEAGATMIFVEGLNDTAVAEQAVEGIRGPVAINVVEGGKSPAHFTFASMQVMGIARVSLPGTLMMAAIQAMQDALAALKSNGFAGRPGPRLADFRETQKLTGIKEVFALEQRYLSGVYQSTEACDADTPA